MQRQISLIKTANSMALRGITRLMQRSLQETFQSYTSVILSAPFLDQQGLDEHPLGLE